MNTTTEYDFEEKSFTCGMQHSGQRLDAALSFLFPGLGLRARRRLWNWCLITVDGKPSGPGFNLQAGQAVLVKPAQGGMRKKSCANNYWLKRIHIVAADRNYLALYKPAGLPSAAVAGKPGDSAENILSGHWSELWSAFLEARPEKGPPLSPGTPKLCNRLDTGTSGLLLAAFSEKAARGFKRLEAAGLARKQYLALVHGAVPPTLYLDQELETDQRKKTRAAGRISPDPARHSAAVRLACYPALKLPPPHAGNADYSGLICLPGPFSLLEVGIKRGARHQIRAHLAEAGFPVVGDYLYGFDAARGAAETRLYLHHYLLRLEDFQALALPDWDFIPERFPRPF